MFCNNCGAEIKNNGKFCPKCGQPVKQDTGERAGVSIEKAQQTTEDTKTQSNTATVVTDPNMAPVMSVWSYLGLFLLSSIPIVGIIMLIVFAIGSNNRNKTNYCRAILLGQVIMVLIIVLFWSSFWGILGNLIY